MRKVSSVLILLLTIHYFFFLVLMFRPDGTTSGLCEAKFGGDAGSIRGGDSPLPWYGVGHRLLETSNT